MTPRIPTLSDVDQIASIHVQCWRETYAGLLPDAEIAKQDMQYRQNLWSKMIEAGTSHLSWIDRVGFAQVGQQRDDTLVAQFPRELYALYVLQKAHGTGAAQSCFTMPYRKVTVHFRPWFLKEMPAQLRSTANPVALY